MAAGHERRLVAVMFTDMVGYTALMQADEKTAVEKRDRYVRALDRDHDAAGGTIVQRLGDGSLSMFPSALAAVHAAVAMQRDLGEAGIPVRIGVHVGEVLVEAERLTGDAVNIAARVESFAAPGSVLLSDTAYDQVKNQLDLEIAPLGSFQFKNVGRPFDLYAVAGDGLVVPERSELEGKGEAIVAIRSPLPEPSSELLGRDRELSDLVGLVRANRVVTMTGPGGVGKTRLATEVARTLAAEFPDGAAFVGFADVTDASGFLAALAAALDVKEAEERSFADGIVALIGDREVLLVLDNLEQIVDAAPDIAGMASRCPELRLLVTSRVPLRVAAEHLYAVDPLPTDDAVALFTARAAATSAGFDAADHTDAIAEICRRLDGLPLAVELAAARVRLLGPDGLRDRLDHALELLTTGARDSHERQQTLRATIDWSYSLLDPPAQEAFRRLAVFAGGCALADAEAVAGEGMLDELESLIDAALVQTDGRLRMLQTIADFAREQLEASGAADEVAARHARRYAAVAREIRDDVEGTQQVAAITRGFLEDDNLQAALDTFLAAAKGGDAEALELGLQMSGDLWMYWHIRGKNLTARDNAAAFLELGLGRPPSSGRAAALITAGLGSWMAGEIERSTREWDEAYATAAAAGAEHERCVAAMARSLAYMTSDPRQGIASAHDAFERAQKLGYPWGEGIAATFEGMLYALVGEPDVAAELFSRALEIQQRLDDWEGAGMSLAGLASLAAARGDSAGALDLYRESLTAFETCGDRGEEARILSEMAWTHLAAGETALARRSFLEAVQAHTDIASVRGVGLALVGLAAVEAVEGRPAQAATLAAAAEVFAQDEGIVVVYSEETPGRELVEQARAALSAEDLAAATEAGRRLTIDEALELARA
jgi:predicted ATPase/class 3 adenylate cyclase